LAELAERPFPPGSYDLVVVGSGPGGLQLSYSLSRLGVKHAVLSQDPAPGGMFRRWPVFQRLLSWTKPYASPDHASRRYERYDWNSLLADEEGNRALMPSLMDGTSYFPSRPEMERGLVTFAERTGIQVRYGCRWEATRREDRGFAVITSDGEYRCRIAVFAVGVAEPWRPSIPGLEGVPHYGDFSQAEAYAGRRVFIVGKQNSGFELASGLLAWARRIIIASPSPTKLSVNTRSLVGVRARYVQPYEDHVLAGGVVILDAAIQSVARTAADYLVTTRSTQDDTELSFEVDDVVAATGFTAPLLDLPALGVATFGQSRLPAQTPFWESPSVPGIYFAGTITQGSAGLKKHGLPSNSGAVHGHRYNARILARHLARSHFGVELPPMPVEPEGLMPYLLSEVSHAPELWHQRSYLARVVSMEPDHGLLDLGILPLADFVDTPGPDAVAIAVEANAAGSIYPAVYLRRRGTISEHLLEPNQLHDFETPEHRNALSALLQAVIGTTAQVSS
jgi:thioredoxin reductase